MAGAGRGSASRSGSLAGAGARAGSRDVGPHLDRVGCERKGETITAKSLFAAWRGGSRATPHARLRRAREAFFPTRNPDGALICPRFAVKESVKGFCDGLWTPMRSLRENRPKSPKNVPKMAPIRGFGPIYTQEVGGPNPSPPSVSGPNSREFGPFSWVRSGCVKEPVKGPPGVLPTSPSRELSWCPSNRRPIGAPVPPVVARPRP